MIEDTDYLDALDQDSRDESESGSSSDPAEEMAEDEWIALGNPPSAEWIAAREIEESPEPDPVAEASAGEVAA